MPEGKSRFCENPWNLLRETQQHQEQLHLLFLDEELLDSGFYHCRCVIVERDNLFEGGKSEKEE